MPSLGSMETEIHISTTGDTSGIEKVERSVSGLDKKTSAVSKAVGFLSKNMAGAVGLASGFGTAVGGLGAFALKSATEMESLRSNMNILTGTVQKGGALYKDLVNFANRTPFETRDLASATSTMLSFGISSDDAMENLRMLGDVSLGNKDKLQGLSLAFSQVQSTGRLMGQDLLQMINNGFNPLQVISQQTGISMSDLKEAMEDGAISADMVTDAFKSATAEGGLFYKGMEIGAQSTEGRISTLMDAVNSLGRSIIGLDEEGNVVAGGILDKFKTGIVVLTDFITNNQDKIVGFFTQMADTIRTNKDVAFALGGAITGVLVGAIVVAMGVIGPAIVTLGALTAAGALLATGIGFLRDKFNENRGALEQFRPVLDFVKGQLADTWDVIQMDLLPALRGLWDAVSPMLMPALKILGSFIGGTLLVVFASMTEWLQGMLRGFSLFTDILSFVIEKVRSLFDWFNKLMSKWNEFALGGLSKLGGNFGDLFKGLGSLLPKFADGVVNFKGGLAEVGERGKEIVYLPPGSSVIPNNQIGNMGAGQTVINNYNEFHRESDPMAFAREIAYSLAVR